MSDRGEASQAVVEKEIELALRDLDTTPANSVCVDHHKIVTGQKLTLRLLWAIYRRQQNNGRAESISWKGLASAAAGLGVPTPVLVFVYLVGQSRGWW